MRIACHEVVGGFVTQRAVSISPPLDTLAAMTDHGGRPAGRCLRQSSTRVAGEVRASFLMLYLVEKIY